MTEDFFLQNVLSSRTFCKMTGGFLQNSLSSRTFLQNGRAFLQNGQSSRSFLQNVEVFFLQNDLSSRTFLQNDRGTQDLGRPPGRSDGRELRATWRDAVAELGPGLEV